MIKNTNIQLGNEGIKSVKNVLSKFLFYLVRKILKLGKQRVSHLFLILPGIVFVGVSFFKVKLSNTD